MVRSNVLLFPALVAALLLAAGAVHLAPAFAQTTSSNTAPVATIDTPTSDTTWAVSDVIDFSGHATDEQEGELQASNLSWDVRVMHCADFTHTGCRPHYFASYEETASGQYIAPYHELPTYMEFSLTATDSEGLTDTDSVRLYPKTVELSFHSEPSGLVLYTGDDGQATPFDRTEIVGSKFSISAPSLQTLAEVDYEFLSWSDGGAVSHEIKVGEQPSTYTATYQQPDTTAPEVPVIDIPSNGTVTSNNTPTFSGSAEAGSTVELFDNGTSLGTSTADGSGGWSFTPGGVLGDGEHRITAKATDLANNQSAVSDELLVTVDTKNPSTAVSSPQANGAGWNNSDVRVSLSATDNDGGSGVDKITYSASGAQTIGQTNVSGSSVEVILDREGTTTLTYYAIDEAGNVEAQETLTVKLDKSAPAGSVLINGGKAVTKRLDVTLNLSASDAGSGVTSMRISNTSAGLSTAQWQPFSVRKQWTLRRGKSGIRTVFVQYKDAADNVTLVALDRIRYIR